MKDETKTRMSLVASILIFIASLVMRELGYRAMAFVLFFVALFEIIALYILMLQYSSKSQEERKTFSQIATSLAGDYESVYYINTKDNSYNEYSLMGQLENKEDGLTIISSGKDFFADTLINTEKLVYKDDREHFKSYINKQKLYEIFRKDETFHLNYRLVKNGKPVYYNLKATKGAGADDKYIVIGVRNVDTETKAHKKALAAAEQGEVFGRIANALASRYEVLYYVDIETNEFYEFSTSEAYSHLDIGHHGYDFFAETQRNLVRDIYVDDYPMMATAMDKSNLLNVIRDKKVFTITYRLILDGEPQYVNLRAMKPRDDNKHIVVGVININESMQREEEFKQRIDTVMNMANRDALTGVKNKNAYSIMENELNEKIAAGSEKDFAVVVCDVNNLKIINDTKGHKAGDEHIREACMMICRVFKHSPVYRIGGDEFVVILKGEDFENRASLLGELRTQVQINKEEDKVVVASGLADYVPNADTALELVFEKADNEMYANKKELKEE
ncbi:diguanylate cyclase (GGDEF) domain-containing protein [Lachnospiraceae bacterium NE2001]|nr:diguanylate cyclase (GGDEF) domain-containing protein [Lachnospiraceae bacterium NE2001]